MEQQLRAAKQQLELVQAGLEQESRQLASTREQLQQTTQQQQHSEQQARELQGQVRARPPAACMRCAAGLHALRSTAAGRALQTAATPIAPGHATGGARLCTALHDCTLHSKRLWH